MIRDLLVLIYCARCIANLLNYYWHACFVWLVILVILDLMPAMHSCCWSTWWAVWSHDRKPQCSMCLFKLENNSYNWWITRSPSSKNSSSWDPYSILCWGSALWTHSFSVIQKHYNDWTWMGSQWVYHNHILIFWVIAFSYQTLVGRTPFLALMFLSHSTSYHVQKIILFSQ